DLELSGLYFVTDHLVFHIFDPDIREIARRALVDTHLSSVEETRDHLPRNGGNIEALNQSYSTCLLCTKDLFFAFGKELVRSQLLGRSCIGDDDLAFQIFPGKILCQSKPEVNDFIVS